MCDAGDCLLRTECGRHRSSGVVPDEFKTPWFVSVPCVDGGYPMFIDAAQFKSGETPRTENQS